MKHAYSVAFVAFAVMMGVFAPRAFSQAALELFLYNVASDSVTVEVRMDNPSTSVPFTLEAVFVTVEYDGTLFTMNQYCIYNHRFANKGFTKESIHNLSADNLALDTTQYGEASPKIGQGTSMPNGIVGLSLCRMKFLPQPGAILGTTSFVVIGNEATAAMTGYYDISSLTNNPFYPVTDLIDVVVPVEMSVFTANQQGQGIALRWRTVREINNNGFFVERRPAYSQEEWGQLGFVKGRGTTEQDIDYLFTDMTLPGAGSYEYRLRQQDYDGSIHLSKIAITEFRPAASPFAFHAAFPNPLSKGRDASSVLAFTLPERSKVRMAVTNLLGQEVNVPFEDVVDGGTYSPSWTPGNLPAGIYVATIIAQEEASGIVYTRSQRMQVIE